MTQVIPVKNRVTVFGNEVYEPDSLGIRLIPELKERMPEVDFVVMDPTENVEPASDPWIILDVAIGIEEVLLIDDLSQLEQVRGQSVHDYDVYMELKLREKLQELPSLRIILIPMEHSIMELADEVEKLIMSLLAIDRGLS